MRVFILQVIIIALALSAGCFRAASSSMFPEAKRLPGGYDALKAVGGAGDFHIVRPGENLYRIARQYGVSVEALKALNGISDELLVRLGARLLIPGPGSAQSYPVPAPKPKSPKAPVACERYFVRPCAGRIVVRFGDMIRGVSSGHIEILAHGGAQVVAAKTGTVVLTSERFPGFGRVVMLQHEKGASTLYGRLGSIEVGHGAVVRQGEKLGTAGSRPVVFQLSINGKVADPNKYVGF